MISRTLQARIEHSLETFPVVGLIGSRQSGKTTLAKAIASQREDAIYLDLERPADLAKLERAEIYLAQFEDRLVILDEIQRRPELFPLLRALVDAKQQSGRFLVLGSATPTLARQASESLAGRIVYHELAPFTVSEIAAEQHRELWSRGGYPRSVLAQTEADSFTWRRAFIQTYLERDLPELGVRVPSARLRRFWEMLAHSHGQLWNASRIAGSLGVSVPTVGRYLDILEETFIIRRLAPYHANLKKRLVKAPKIYLRDSGILHALLRIADLEGLLGHPQAGLSWEGWIVEQVAELLPDTWGLHFFRTRAGAEIDLVLLPPGRQPIAIEIKLSLSPKLSRGFRIAFEDLGCEQGYLVYPGGERYPMTGEVDALPVTELGGIFD